MKVITNRHGPAKEMRARFLTERNGPIVNMIEVPSFTATVNIDPKLPRISAGEISPKYIGVVAKAMPVARPHVNLDMYSSCEVEKGQEDKEIERAKLIPTSGNLSSEFNKIPFFFLLEEYYMKILYKNFIYFI